MRHEITSFADVQRAATAWSSPKKYTHSLDHMYELMECLGDPHKRLRVVHVAGTSGKTSTAYYTAALLKEAGFKVGLTVSPHAKEVNERVQIGLVPLPEAEFCERFNKFLEVIKHCRVVPGYFEMWVAFAIWEFAARGVDYAVIEAGVGGLLDSTNIFDDPKKVCVITDIGYDHTKILGSTLPEIARQKAGIIQLNNAVFCNRQDDEIVDVFSRQTRQKQADLHVIRASGLDKEFDFLPLFQRHNFGLALNVVNYILDRDRGSVLAKEAVSRAAHTRVPWRMDIFEIGGKMLILDVAHNPQKLSALLESVAQKYPGEAVAALVCMSVRDGSSRNAAPSLKVVLRAIDYLIITGLPDGERSDKFFKPEELAEACHQAGFEAFEVAPDPAEALKHLLDRKEPVLLVTGSTYLLNHIWPLLPLKSRG